MLLLFPLSGFWEETPQDNFDVMHCTLDSSCSFEERISGPVVSEVRCGTDICGTYTQTTSLSLYYSI